MHIFPFFFFFLAQQRCDFSVGRFFLLDELHIWTILPSNESSNPSFLLYCPALGTFPTLGDKCACFHFLLPHPPFTTVVFLFTQLLKLFALGIKCLLFPSSKCPQNSFRQFSAFQRPQTQHRQHQCWVDKTQWPVWLPIKALSSFLYLLAPFGAP